MLQARLRQIAVLNQQCLLRSNYSVTRANRVVIAHVSRMSHTRACFVTTLFSSLANLWLRLREWRPSVVTEDIIPLSHEHLQVGFVQPGHEPPVVEFRHHDLLAREFGENAIARVPLVVNANAPAA